MDAEIRKICADVGKDLYGFLGVRFDASQEEIHNAYKKLAHIWHPDKNHAPNAKTVFENIGAAHSVLTDSNKKAVYDKQTEMFHLPLFSFGAKTGSTFFRDDKAVEAGDPFAPLRKCSAKNYESKEYSYKFPITLLESYEGITLYFTCEYVPIKDTFEITRTLDETGHKCKIYPGVTKRKFLMVVNKRRVILTIVVEKSKSRINFELVNKKKVDPILKTEMSISLSESLLGTEKYLLDMARRYVPITIPELTRDKTVIKIPEFGWPKTDDKGITTYGPLTVEINIVYPSLLTLEQKDILRTVLS